MIIATSVLASSAMGNLAVAVSVEVSGSKHQRLLILQDLS